MADTSRAETASNIPAKNHDFFFLRSLWDPFPSLADLPGAFVDNLFLKKNPPAVLIFFFCFLPVSVGACGQMERPCAMLTLRRLEQHGDGSSDDVSIWDFPRRIRAERMLSHGFGRFRRSSCRGRVSGKRPT